MKTKLWWSVFPILAGLFLIAPGASGAGFPAADKVPTAQGDLEIAPVNHASLVLGWKGMVVLVDPVGPASRYASFGKPALILITHTHPDHLSPDTLKGVTDDKTVIVAPPAVAEKLPMKSQAVVLTNGESKEIEGLKIEAVPAYNTTPERKQYHPKGVGNGYVVTFGDKRVYIAGDTEDIPEMRALKNIDVAFICMNLPYTMTVEQAASAVKEFKPKIVYPYHYRGADLEKFKTLVGNSGTEVRLRDWYK